MTARRHRRWREEVNSGNLFLQIWQLREATFNQQLGSLPTKSRAKILPRCGWDYPLPPPINRGGFDGLREEKIGSKKSPKIGLLYSIFLQPVLSLLSLTAVAFSHHHPHHWSFHHQLHHKKPPTDHRQPPRGLPSPSADFLLLFFFFLPPPQAANPATISSTSTFAIFMPDQWQQLLLLRKVASHFTPSSATAKLHAERELIVHVLQLIHPSLGPGQLWPGPNVWLGLARPQKKRRKKICWAEIGPTFLDRDRPNRFLGFCLAQLPGPARPTCFNNI